MWESQKTLAIQQHYVTCKWILAHKSFMTWLDNKEGSILWIHGVPGSGKSTLASLILEHINIAQEENTITASYFHSSQHESKHSARGILVSIIKQITTQQGFALSNLALHQTLASLHDNAKIMTPFKIRHYFRTITSSLATDKNLVLIIDGLNVTEELQEQLLREIVRVAYQDNSKRPGLMRCLVTSRDYEMPRLPEGRILETIYLGKEISVQQAIAQFIAEKLDKLIVPICQ